MKKNHLHQSDHTIDDFPFEALCSGSWHPVESINIRDGNVNLQFLDTRYEIHEKGPFGNVRLRSRKAKMPDCTCFLRPGIDVCVLLADMSRKESLEPVWVDTKIDSIERKPHESRCLCRFYVKLYDNQVPLGSEKVILSKEISEIGIDHTLFIREEQGEKLMVSLYVDDLMYTSSSDKLTESFKSNMQTMFEMTDLGRMKYFLGVEVNQTNQGFFICKKNYIRDLLKRYGLLECNPVRNPIVPGCKLTIKGDGCYVDDTQYKKMVGCLLYLTATRPDVMFVVGLLSRYLSKPTEVHLQAAKRVFRYLKGTIDYGIWYKRDSSETTLIGFTDSDYAQDEDARKSTGGYVFFLSGGAISWSSKKQPIVTLSTTEAEFVVAASCAAHCVWLRRVLEEMSWKQSVTNETTILCDNMSTIKLSRIPVLHGRSKHIDVRFHFLRDLVKNGTIHLEYCSTKAQIADIMTKPVKLETFELLRGRLGIKRWSDVMNNSSD